MSSACSVIVASFLLLLNFQRFLLTSGFIVFTGMVESLQSSMAPDGPRNCGIMAPEAVSLIVMKEDSRFKSRYYH